MILQSFSHLFRTRRHKLGPLNTLVEGPPPRIIDIGGDPHFWRIQSFHGSVVCLNILPQSAPADPRIRCVVGDARDLRDFKDGEFDVAVSNSLIEHVGSWRDQQCCAREIRRVARSYYVQTPNRLFPVEPHFAFPGLQFLALPIRRSVAAHWPFGFVRGPASKRIAELDSMRLLDEREMRLLFPDALVWRERLFGLTKSLIAYRSPA